MIIFNPQPKFNRDAAVILLTKETLKGKAPCAPDSGINESIRRLAADGHFAAEAGQLFPLASKKTVILLAGLGAQDALSHTQLRVHARRALVSNYLCGAKTVEILPHRQSDADITAVIEAAVIGTYRWSKYKSGKTQKPREYIVCAKPSGRYDQAVAVSTGVNFARDLINDNADVTTSAYLEKTVRTIVRGRKNVQLEVLGRKEMLKKGLGLHLAVNQGSKNEPKLVIVKYTGAPGQKSYTALVGKGMTFDTGGLNLKPTGGIEAMKLDMAGAAAVIGVLKNTIDLRLKKNVIFAVALAENVIGSGAYKPGDVIVGYAKKSVEVANTDAEGRLVLADAMAYVIKNYKPKKLIDIATLTGACIIALGCDYTGLVSTSDDLAKKLIESSKASDDWAWRLPIYPELAEAVKSKIADIRNMGYAKGAAGTITAAEFLRQFAGGTEWAHLDIAGSSFVDNGERLYFGYGATASGVRLLTHYIGNNQ